MHGLWAIATWASSDTAGTWWDTAGTDLDDEALWLSARRSWQLGVPSPGVTNSGGLTAQLIIPFPPETSPARVLPAAAQPIGPRPKVGTGGVIDLSVTLGDADIHLESEPSGTFNRNRASDRPAIEGAGAASPCYWGTGRTDTDDGASLAFAYDVDLTFAKNLVPALTRVSLPMKSPCSVDP